MAAVSLHYIAEALLSWSALLANPIVTDKIFLTKENLVGEMTASVTERRRALSVTTPGLVSDSPCGIFVFQCFIIGNRRFKARGGAFTDRALGCH